MALTKAQAEALILKAEDNWGEVYGDQRHKRAVSAVRQAQNLDQARNALNILSRTQHRLPSPDDILAAVMDHVIAESPKYEVEVAKDQASVASLVRQMHDLDMTPDDKAEWLNEQMAKLETVPRTVEGCANCGEGRGWILTGTKQTYAIPCSECMPGLFARWEGRHLEAGHWCDECAEVKRSGHNPVLLDEPIQPAPTPPEPEPLPLPE